MARPPAELLADLAEAERALAVVDRQDPAALAVVLHDLSVCHGRLGHTAAALTAATEAVAACRVAAAAQPTMRLHLATALINLSGCQRELADHDGALASASEGVGLRRQLHQESPEATVADLALALGHLTGCLARVGRDDEALAAAQESVALRRELAATDFPAHAADLAASLNNLSNRYAEQDRIEEALAAIDEAVTLYRQTRPSQHADPDLAMALSNQAGLLLSHGDAVGALAAAESAVASYVELAGAFTGRYEEALYAAATALVLCLAELSRDASEHDGLNQALDLLVARGVFDDEDDD